MSTAVPIIRQDGEGEQMWFAGGGLFTWKATAAETDGVFFLLEDQMVRGKRTPLHLHPVQDEAMYMLEARSSSMSRASSVASAPAASSSRPAESRTPSWSSRRPRACSR